MKQGIGIRSAGVLSPLAVGSKAFMSALIDGYSAIPTLDENGRQAMRVPQDPATLFDTPKTYLDRASALTLAATALARRDAEWIEPPNADGDPNFEVGVSMGTAYGCPDSMLRFWQSVEQKGARLANALFFSHSYPNIPASLESIEHSFAGHHLTFVNGKASGALAVVAAMDALRMDECQRIIAAGFDTISPADLSSETARLFGPISFLPAGEGAVALALELSKTPSASNDVCLAHLVGSGCSSFLMSRSADGTCSPRGQREAIRSAMELALADASCKPHEVGVVILSASGSAWLDRAEAQAFTDLFESSPPPCTAISARTGFAPGAAPFYGILAASVALREEWITEVGCPVGPDAALLPSLALEPIERKVSVALVNSIDDDGACVCLALRR